MSDLRFKSVEEASSRKPVEVKLPEESVEKYYAKQVFNRQKMFEYLPQSTYQALVDAIDNKKPLSLSLADSVAEGIAYDECRRRNIPSRVSAGFKGIADASVWE